MLESWMADEAARGRGRPKGGENARRAAATTFAHAVAVVGLTYEEAAVYLDRSLQSVRAYAAGIRRAPPEVMDALANLWEEISFRTPPKGPLPGAAAARRQALQDLRARSWKAKDRSPDPDEGDDEDE